MRELENGTSVNKYFIGSSILMAPFFLIAHFLALLSDVYDANGYTLPYYISVVSAGVFYVAAGLTLLSIFLYKQFKNEFAAVAAPLFILFGSNLLYYGAVEPSMSHAYSFFLISAFIFLCDSVARKPSILKLVLLGIVMGLIAIVRPVNLVVLSLVPFFLVSNLDLPTFSIKNGLKPFLAIIPVFLSIVYLQLLAYHWQTGEWIVWAYKGEGFNWDSPEIIKTLFSYKRGLFVYAPVCLLSLLGIYHLWKLSSVKSMTLVTCLTIVIYVVSSWHAWGYGWAYGLRAYVEFLPLFAIPLAAMLSMAKPKLKWGIVSVAVLFCVYTQIQTYQVTEQILPLAGIEKQEFWEIFLRF